MQNQKTQNNGEYRNVAIEVLAESPSNPRKRFNEESLKELAATATISGVAFTVIFFTAFSLSEKRYAPKVARKPKLGEAETERFRLQVRENLSPVSLQVRPGSI